MSDKTLDPIKLLFNDNEYICAGDIYATKPTPQPPILSEFFSLNALDPDFDHLKSGTIESGGRRTDYNIVTFRNFLFEMDNLPLDEQLAIFNKCQSDFATITYSGSKSYHAIVSLETSLSGTHTTTGILHYKAVWRALAAHIAEQSNVDPDIFDSSCQNPSRLTRFPGYKAPNRLRQDLVSVNERMNDQRLNEILTKHYKVIKQQDQPQYTDQPPTSENLKLLIPVALADKFWFPSKWSRGASGNYPEIYKLVLWLIDSTGVTEDVGTQYLEKNLIPGLVATGYPADRIYKAIKDAFTIKETR